MGHVVTHRRHRTYPLHRSGGEQPSEAVMALCHAAWRALGDLENVSPPDPHLFPNLYRTLRGALRQRLLRYSIRPVADRPCRHCGSRGDPNRGGDLLTLEIRRPLPEFVRSLSALAVRRLWGTLRLTSAQRRQVRRRLQEEMLRSLAEHVRTEELCVHCDPRQGFPDRRVWLAGAGEAVWKTWAPGVGHDWMEMDMDLLDEE